MKYLKSLIVALILVVLLSSVLPTQFAFAATETLRPNGQGDNTQLVPVGEADNWNCVNDTGSGDGDSTYVSTSTTSFYDLYTLTDTTATGTIASITVYVRAEEITLNATVAIKIKTGGTEYTSGSQSLSTSYALKSNTWATNPKTAAAWTKGDLDALQVGVIFPTIGLSARCTQVYVVVDFSTTAPTVTTQAASGIEATTATGNGNITVLGTGGNCEERGFDWDIDSGSPYTYDDTETGDFSTGAYTLTLTSLSTGVTIYYRAKAYDGYDWGYGSEQTFLTKPAAPTNVSATDGTYTDKVTITWTKSTGATNYVVYRDGGNVSGTLGDVATYNDSGAGVSYITAGAAVASDGDYTAYVTLSLTGQSANHGIASTYYVVASNATGNSSNSSTNDGYIGVGSLTYQWQRSAADSDASYSNISGGTTLPYDDIGAPTNGNGRYFKCVMDATGASQQTSTANRGYRQTELGDISSMTGTVTSTSIVLIWAKATGASETLVRYRTNTYPSSTTDGELGYSGTNYHCTIEDLTPGQVYYIAAWGSGGTNYSTNAYHVVLSTTAVNIPTGASPAVPEMPSLPEVPASSMQTPDYSGFNLQPFTGMITYFVEAEGGLGMPLENVWEMLWILLIIISGLVTYIKIKNFFVAYFVVFILTFIGVGLRLVQAELVAIEVIVGAGIWAIERYMQ